MEGSIAFISITPPFPIGFDSVTIAVVGDGHRVKSVMQTNYASTITYFVGTHYEVVETYTGTQVNKYYYAGSQRIAMRKNGTLNFIIGDHLGSTSLVTDASGVVINQTQYKAWGEERYSSGLKSTGYGYTGQYSYAGDFGLQFYNARWYDSSLGRFAQADTIVPGGSQGYDRYAYANNNPVKYTDPTGHRCKDDDENIWGYCGDILPAPNKVTTYQNAYLGAVARKHGVHLSPQDHWEYLEYGSLDGDQSFYGMAPAKVNELFFDKVGLAQYAQDNTVIITQRSFRECGPSTECLAELMAHEATHSWIEWKIDQKNLESTTDDYIDRFSGNYKYAEELYADLVASQISPENPILKLHTGTYLGYCQEYYGDSCSNPQALWESYFSSNYGINLVDISNLVYGR